MEFISQLEFCKQKWHYQACLVFNLKPGIQFLVKCLLLNADIECQGKY